MIWCHSLLPLNRTCFLNGTMGKCHVPCAVNSKLVKKMFGLPLIPHRFRPASHSVPYRLHPGHNHYDSERPGRGSRTCGPVQRLLAPARWRRLRRRPARMGPDRTGLEYGRRFRVELGPRPAGWGPPHPTRS